MGALEGRSWTDIKQRIYNVLSSPSTLRSELIFLQNSFYLWKRAIFVFGPVQCINVWLVPVYARPPVMNCVALGYALIICKFRQHLELTLACRWGTFLATVNQRANNAPKPPEAGLIVAGQV